MAVRLGEEKHRLCPSCFATRASESPPGDIVGSDAVRVHAETTFSLTRCTHDSVTLTIIEKSEVSL